MFNPSELTVKQARARLCELDIAGLEELLQAEIDGKHRSSLMADIGRTIDMIKTAEESEAVADVVVRKPRARRYGSFPGRPPFGPPKKK